LSGSALGQKLALFFLMGLPHFFQFLFYHASVRTFRDIGFWKIGGPFHVVWGDAPSEMDRANICIAKQPPQRGTFIVSSRHLDNGEANQRFVSNLATAQLDLAVHSEPCSRYVRLPRQPTKRDRQHRHRHEHCSYGKLKPAAAGWRGHGCILTLSEGNAARGQIGTGGASGTQNSPLFDRRLPLRHRPSAGIIR
jgi:hypothetical protein